MITQKHRAKVILRRQTLQRLAGEISDVQKVRPGLRLIIIHGAGNAGHRLASEYDLKNGTHGDTAKLQASLAIRSALQKLNSAVTDAMLGAGIMAVPIHTGSAVIQDNGQIAKLSFDQIDLALSNGCVPIMYGEMVFDVRLGMSVCSGDDIAMTLAARYSASKIIFASDVDGIYTYDPHKYPDARLIRSISLDNLKSNSDISLSGSHNVDVTGGLQNKITTLASGGMPESLQKVIICNGLKPGVVGKSLTDSETGTIITI